VASLSPLHNYFHPLCRLSRSIARISQWGGAKNDKEGPNFFNTRLDVCSNRGAKHQMGEQVLNGGPGTTGPPAGDDSEIE